PIPFPPTPIFYSNSNSPVVTTALEPVPPPSLTSSARSLPGPTARRCLACANAARFTCPTTVAPAEAYAATSSPACPPATLSPLSPLPAVPAHRARPRTASRLQDRGLLLGR
ncbi:unnamed protein product, partial [Musa hybrid cultivar]